MNTLLLVGGIIPYRTPHQVYLDSLNIDSMNKIIEHNLAKQGNRSLMESGGYYAFGYLGVIVAVILGVYLYKCFTE